jgi:cobalamin biosynthesis protein CobD/CbiB
MPTPRIVKEHPVLACMAAAAAYRAYTEHQHPGQRARQREQGRGLLVLLVLLTAVVAWIILCVIWIILCVTWYGLRWALFKLLRLPTAPPLRVPGIYPRKVAATAPLGAGGR